MAGDEEFLRALVRTALQEVLEAEMTEALGAEKGEWTAGRLGYRSGYYGRTLITRIGKLELPEHLYANDDCRHCDAGIPFVTSASADDQFLDETACFTGTGLSL